MEFTFLGTSAGTPTKSRNVTGLALSHGGPKHWYLIDCGEGTQHQLLRTHHSVIQLQAIFITHIHGDHTFGLPGLLTSASMLGRITPLYLVAPRPVRTFVEAALGNSDSSLSFELRFVDSEAENFRWEDDALSVTAVPLSHRVSCRAFVFTEKNLERQLLRDKLEADGIEAGPAWGRLQQGQDVVLEDGRLARCDDYTRIARKPRKVIVAGDNDQPDLLLEASTDVQVVVHEATYTQEVSDRVGPWPQHSSAAQVARFAEAAGVPNLVLTHFSSRYQLNPDAYPHIGEIESEATGIYRGKLYLARDFARYTLSKDLMFNATERL
ncbi:MBL fold metallo-hydrolase [Marinobacter sp. EhC06]|jgi:ribonuclease Z|uniref:ribonuclease Z n=1 Tax=Marinobacter TaxID=2742 RepID=UPI0007D8DE1F|nr:MULTISPECIES: ribonuclease Z [unclassified Marinobacter]OAN93770.1 MBL fold metallo-hydrolase [Marinobacter sp. EhC06]OAN94634.1 MBL fold metallo-hydrolase [Marinobacter sp. EhN04]